MMALLAQELPGVCLGIMATVGQGISLLYMTTNQLTTHVPRVPYRRRNIMLNIATRMEAQSHVSRHYVFGCIAGWHQCYNHDLHQHAHHHRIINLMFDSCLQALFYLNSTTTKNNNIFS